MLQKSETERLGFVQVSTYKGSWVGNLFKPIVSTANVYSIEVFRGRYYIGSITVSDTLATDQIRQQLKSKKVQNGDTLIWVSLTSQKVDLEVSLTTIDGNTLPCKLTLMLKVDASKASNFANFLNRDNDPVEMVKPPITNALKKYISQRSYHELDNDDMQQRVIRSLYGENKQYGLMVESILDLSVIPDEHITKRIQITQEGGTNALQDKMDQDRISQQNIHRRSEEGLDKVHQRTQDLQDNLHETHKEGLMKQIERSLNAGKPSYQIMEDHSDFTGNMYAPLSEQRPAGEVSWRDRARLVPGSPESKRMIAGRTIGDNQQETNDEIPGILKQNRIVFGLREAGITVFSVRLSARQRATSGVQTLTAMLVCQIDADNDTFAVGDLITMIKGIATTDIQTLILCLKENHPATLSAQVLRGSEMIEITINSME